MNRKKIPKGKVMESLSFAILQKELARYGVFVVKYPFEDTGLDLLIKVPRDKAIEVENNKYKVNQFEDSFDRMMYGQLKSSQDKRCKFSENSAKYRFEVIHLKMWKEAGLPVIIFLVDLRYQEKETIYWKHIDNSLEIKEKQKKQTIQFNKKINENSLKEFNQILELFSKTKNRGSRIESDVELKQYVDEFPYHKEMSLLPDFTEFKEKREKWMREREELIFQEFNPIKWNGEWTTETPKVGYRALIPKTEYARFADPSKPYIISTISDDIVREIFLSERRKLLEDLINYSKKYEELYTFNQIEEAQSVLEQFEEPLLLFSTSNLQETEFKEKYLREIFNPENIQENKYYLKSKITIGDKKVEVIEIPSYSSMDSVSDELIRMKAILIDKGKVEYRVKEPLHTEWRTPTIRATVWDKDSQQHVKDPHNFDFLCYTLAEIFYDGPMVIWWFRNQI
ncbi:MAG: DUF4365 domain-containing protein [Candidatus Heimdallarchaeaceae archaeon]